MIKREDLTALAQLLSGMKDAVAKMEKAKKKNDEEQLAIGKKQILDFQRKIGEIL
jgi:hypothetical protein